MASGLCGLIIIVFGDVGHADDEHAHLSTRTMYDAGRDVDEGAFADGMGDAIEQHLTTTFQHIIELGGALVIMQARTINIYSMCPCGRVEGCILMADESVTPAASAALTRGVALMADE